MRCRKCGTDNALLKKWLRTPKTCGIASALSVFMDLVNEHRVILWIGSFVAGLAYAHFFGRPWG